ncbi:MAG: GDSL-type esterase/lipase family protein [Planctomycetota bacterium]|jgi:lysophospholipase L1-like esterase
MKGNRRSAASICFLSIAGAVMALPPWQSAQGGLPRIGAMGDSLTDEYLEESYSYAQSWVQQLVIHRGLDAGPTALEAAQPGGTWGEPRRTGYEYDWARSGATSGSLLSQGQHTGLAAQVVPDGIDYAVLAIGANDFNPTGSAYFNIYFGFWSSTQIQNYISQSEANIESALGTIAATGVPVVLVNVLDFGLVPAVWTSPFYSNPNGRQNVANVIAQLNDRLIDVARDHDAVLVDASAFAQAVFGSHHALNEFLPIGNVDIQLWEADTTTNTNPLAGFVDDGAHPHTHLQGVIANLMVEALNTGYGAGIPLFSEQEILAHAGIAYGGADTLEAEIGPYSDYIFDFGCPADITADGAVNVLDLIELLLCFGQPATGGCAAADINGDGIVNVLDLIELLLVFGTSCP